jgi:hypothetical protein
MLAGPCWPGCKPWPVHSKSPPRQQLRQRPFKPPCGAHPQRLVPTLWALLKPLAWPQRITLRRHCFCPTTSFTFKGEGPGFDRHFYAPWSLRKLIATRAFNYRDKPVRSADRTRHQLHSNHAERVQDPRLPARSPGAVPNARASGQE